MNRLVHMAAAGAWFAFGAAAQDAGSDRQEEGRTRRPGQDGPDENGRRHKRHDREGAPYSGEEVNENNQMLADGTRIHREVRTTVYRDSEGRTRRETPESITITDPVANVTYFLNPKTMTGQKLPMASGNFSFIRSDSLVLRSQAKPLLSRSTPAGTVRPR